MLREVTMPKAALIEKLTENRSHHREVFEEAIEGYRIAVITALEEQIANARSGRQVNLRLVLPQPEDHTKEYDQALAMLEHEVADEVTLDEHTYAELVLDDWGWKGQFLTASNSYLVNPVDR